MRLRLCIFFSLCPVLVHSQTLVSKDQLSEYVAQRSQQISTYWREGKIREAVAILETLYTIPRLREIEWAWTSTLYNLACGYSLLGNKDKALSYLDEAVQEGYSDYDQILGDSDLNNIRNDARYDLAVREMRLGYYRWNSPSLSSNYRDSLSEVEKVAGLAKVWSEVKYGFAYFDRVPAVDWDSLFVSALKDVKSAKSTSDYYRVLQKTCAHLQDGHTRIEVPSGLFREMYAHPAIQTRLLEDRVLVVNVFSDSLEKTGIHAGLEIVRVDGISVKEYARKYVEPYQSASTTQGRLTNTYEYYLLCGPAKRPVELELTTKNGTNFKRTLPRNYYRFQNYRTSCEFKVLEGKIAYLAVNTFGDRNVVAQFDSLFPFIDQSLGLVLDLRENSGGSSDIAYEILGRLADKPFKIVQGKSRMYSAFSRAMGKRQEWSSYPSSELQASGVNCLSKPVVVLISSRTASAAEDFCAVFRHLQRGSLIGTPTAGSTGQPLFYGLPGGGTGVVCTMQIFSPDGGEFNGIGVLPDITVAQTVSDVRSSTDAALRTALSTLTRGRK